MFAALQEAEQALQEEEVPVGAVVVHKGKIIGRGRNQVELLKDPTAHAEIIALSAAGNYLRDWRLNECDMYVTLEPCIMCTGAMLASRINNLFFAAYDPKYGACGSLYNLAEEGKYNHRIKTFSGIYSNESIQLLKSFFGSIRNT
ncbi:MAG: tRNA adenosine(34) deaminase TadA [Ignavibacteriaceae bacterium]|nr:tRNA adenosine(34) deaminase TadA [Ignavibacteriaceae bacterium]